jgi:hypothetical protein
MDHGSWIVPAGLCYLSSFLSIHQPSTINHDPSTINHDPPMSGRQKRLTDYANCAG